MIYSLSTRILLACLSAFLLGQCFPSASHSLLIWVAMAPLCAALHRTDGRTGFMLAFITGCGFYATIHQWGFIFGPHVWLALTLWQGFYTGLWGALAASVLKEEKPGYRLFLPALLWVAYEYIKSLGPMGINWGSLAYSLYQWTAVIQVAGITGIYGLSFLIMLVNSSVAELIILAGSKEGKLVHQKPLMALIASTALIFILVLSYGGIVLTVDSRDKSMAPCCRVGLIQPNVDISVKWDQKALMWNMGNLEALSRQAKAEGAQLMIWPETAVPTALPAHVEVTERLLAYVRNEGFMLLTGAQKFFPPDQLANAAFLIAPGTGIMQDYCKNHLVPFGEYLPLSAYLRKYALFERVQNISPRKGLTVFKTPWGTFSVLICFESDFPHLARLNVLKGARFLVVITNDAWFERSAVAAHHITWDVFRAVENHTPLLQSGNTGLCCFIDANGRIGKMTEVYKRGFIVDDLRLPRSGTFYTRHGDLFALLCIIAAAGWLAAEKFSLSRAPEKRKKKGRR